MTSLAPAKRAIEYRDEGSGFAPGGQYDGPSLPRRMRTRSMSIRKWLHAPGRFCGQCRSQCSGLLGRTRAAGCRPPAKAVGWTPRRFSAPRNAVRRASGDLAETRPASRKSGRSAAPCRRQRTATIEEFGDAFHRNFNPPGQVGRAPTTPLAAIHPSEWACVSRHASFSGAVDDFHTGRPELPPDMRNKSAARC